jgi:preprotein translocase subunit SecG
MYSLLTILIVILAVLLILIVLVQNSKGGGLAANFASTNQIMGVRKTTDFLEKTTWTLIGVIVLFCVLATAFHKTDAPTTTSEIADQVEMPVQAPAGFDDAAVELPTEVATEEATTTEE